MVVQQHGFPLKFILLLVLLLSGSAVAQSPAKDDVFKMDGLGKGSAEISGAWRFHTGDDLRWSRVDIHDAAGQNGWESMGVDRPWGAQSHYAYAGFAWYRRRIEIVPASGATQSLDLMMPPVEDCYQVFWNGSLVGTYGHMPPYAWWPAASAPRVFRLPGSPTGTLAIRVWKGPLGSSASGFEGGLTGPPEIGDARSIEGRMAIWNYEWMHSNLYANALNVLYLSVGCAALLLWFRRRNQMPLFWFAVFAISPVLWSAVYALHLPVPNNVTDFVLQPLFALRDVALWYLLLNLMDLSEHRKLVSWANRVAVLIVAAGFLDGCLTFVQPVWVRYAGLAWVDAILTLVMTGCEAYALVLVAAGLRQRLNWHRWVLALSAFTSQMLIVVVAAAQQGQRFTHWTLAQRLSRPLFFVGGVYFTAQTLADTVLFLSILHAIYRYLQEQQSRKALLEQELRSARELQQILIPDDLPLLPGYRMSSSYRPAREVGGDFFQIIPVEGATLIALGDVSGKGLRAAMAVSLIVGALRILADTTFRPCEILAALNRRLYGRLQGGFTTCLVLRLQDSGICTLAGAGHPSPFLNDVEVQLPGALPLGIGPSTTYEETTLEMQPGDRFALYTDGLLEARTRSGELFSFDRLRELFATPTDAVEASEAAIAFGQDDDITVLTFTRIPCAETQLQASH